MLSLLCVSLSTWPFQPGASLDPPDQLGYSTALSSALRENTALKQRVRVLEADALEKSNHVQAKHGEHNASTLLTRGRLLSVTGPSKQIILTFVNNARLEFAVTWAAHLARLKLTNWLIGATDHDALASMLNAGTPCFAMTTALPEGEWSWGSPSFHSLGPHKIELIHQALSWGFEVVITDADALVMREPFAYMARWPDAGFLTTTDHLFNTTSDGGLEKGASHSAYNIGYMFFRPFALPMVAEWRRSVLSDPVNKWDQAEFASVVRYGWKPNLKQGLSDDRLFFAFKGKAACVPTTYLLLPCSEVVSQAET